MVIPTAGGELGILPGHMSLIAKVAEGEIRVSSEGKTQSFTVIGGFMEVLNDSVSVLADHAVRSEEIESQKAEESRTRAEALLKEKRSGREFAHIEKDLRKAVVELKISQKYRKKR